MHTVALLFVCSERDAEYTEKPTNTFDEDWCHEYATAEDALADAIKSESIERRTAAAEELDAFILRVEEAPDPYRVMMDAGCWYYTLADGLTAVEWLNHVRTILRRSLHDSQNSKTDAQN